MGMPRRGIPAALRAGLLDEPEPQKNPINLGVSGILCKRGFVNSLKSVLQTGWRNGSAQLSNPGLALSTSC